MNLSVYDGARWVSITPHAFSHAIGGKDELIPEAIGAASTLFVEDAISTHLDETDPHPQYLTQSEGDTLYAGAGAISDHVATSDPHPQYLTQSEGDTLYAPNNAIASHLATSNPHLITPTLIGAAPTSHTHTGTQISGNISGNAANITGIAAIANGGTGASTAAAALTNLGAAAASHTHTGAQISGNISGNAANVTGVVAIANGGTGASTAAAALTNLGAAAASHTHTGAQITGNISGSAANITGIAAIANGGTGASTAAAALTNLGASALSHTHPPLSSPGTIFQSGWMSYDRSYSFSIHKIDRLIIISGLVERISGSSSLIATLPTQFRPLTRQLFICWGYYLNQYTIFRIDVEGNGNILILNPSVENTNNIAWISLCGLTFVTP